MPALVIIRAVARFERCSGHCLDKYFRFIAIALPRAVVLENVAGLNQGKHKQTFKMMMTLLESMEEYEWSYRLLNTKDYGIPQNRPRLYIVGIRRIHAGMTFLWPSPTAVSPQLDDFLDAEPDPVPNLVRNLPPPGTTKRQNILAALEKLMDQNLNPYHTPAVCGANNRSCMTMLNCSPCLTRARAATQGHWLLHRGRYMTTGEIFRLQGLTPARWVRPGGCLRRTSGLAQATPCLAISSRRCCCQC